ncbi:MAG: sulfotransferase [Myxococcota bacterium]
MALAETIVVVSGIPRTGTSLMMKMLGRAGIPLLVDDKRSADDSNPHGYFELSAVRRTREDADWVASAPGQAVKVIHQLLSALPRQYSYRVILMQRPIEQVVASQDRMLTRLGADSDDLPKGRVHEILTEQHHRARELLESETCFDWIEVDYPELVQDPEPHARRVLEFLSLDADPAQLASAVDPELHRERS